MQCVLVTTVIEFLKHCTCNIQQIHAACFCKVIIICQMSSHHCNFKPFKQLMLAKYIKTSVKEHMTWEKPKNTLKKNHFHCSNVTLNNYYKIIIKCHSKTELAYKCVGNHCFFFTLQWHSHFNFNTNSMKSLWNCWHIILWSTHPSLMSFKHRLVSLNDVALTDLLFPLPLFFFFISEY